MKGGFAQVGRASIWSKPPPASAGFNLAYGGLAVVAPETCSLTKLPSGACMQLAEGGRHMQFIWQ
eukprot:230817-Amphidinium_carterae.1